MFVVDGAKYERHRNSTTGIDGFWLTALLFGSMGAIAWAIRGTDGWGGIDGTIVPGLTWGLLWYYVCYRKGIDARGIVLWLGMGIALGGELGYGQYVSWIQGNFQVRDEIIPVAPWIGYAWFVICGIGWAAPGGILLGWALSGKTSVGCWVVRCLVMVPLFVALFAWPLLDSLREHLVQTGSAFLFPNAGLGIYEGGLDKHLGRTVYTNTQNFAVVVWWVGAMLVAALQRDRATLVSGAVIGGGFGIGFMLSALWCLGYTHAPGYIDWWKVWELNAGFNLGLLYVVVLYWAMRQVDKAPPVAQRSHQAPFAEWCTSGFLALSGFLLVFAAGFEYFFWTGVGLGSFYVVAMFLAIYTFDANSVAERRRGVSLIFSAFLLVFILLHGVSSRAGVLLELYTDEAVDQYAWPPGRVALFVPVAAVLVSVALLSMGRMLWFSDASSTKTTTLPERMATLLMFIGVVGAVSIWPSKIGVLYAVFLCFAIFAFTRLNRRFDEIDGPGSLGIDAGFSASLQDGVEPQDAQRDESKHRGDGANE